MLWLTITISAYFILAIVFLVDKYLLVSAIPNPKVYAFYIGFLGIAVLLLIPFIEFYIPGPRQILLAFISGATFVYGILWFFKGLKLFDASRMVPAVGGILPIFTFLLIFLFSGGRETFNFWEIVSFLLLICGSILITYERSKKISLKSFNISVIAAFFFALSFVFSKYVYMQHPFLMGLVWIRIGGVLTAFALLFSRELRREIFKKETGLQKKTVAIFLSSQAAGGGANILQNWAVALAPLIYVAFINALQGIQYVFLLFFTIFLSLKFPQTLKEEISKEIIFQKIIAILLIGGGLSLLAL